MQRSGRTAKTQSFAKSPGSRPLSPSTERGEKETAPTRKTIRRETREAGATRAAAQPLSLLGGVKRFPPPPTAASRGSNRRRPRCAFGPRPLCNGTATLRGTSESFSGRGVGAASPPPAPHTHSHTQSPAPAAGYRPCPAPPRLAGPRARDARKGARLREKPPPPERPEREGLRSAATRARKLRRRRPSSVPGGKVEADPRRLPPYPRGPAGQGWGGGGSGRRGGYFYLRHQRHQRLLHGARADLQPRVRAQPRRGRGGDAAAAARGRGHGGEPTGNPPPPPSFARPRSLPASSAPAARTTAAAPAAPPRRAPLPRPPGHRCLAGAPGDAARARAQPPSRPLPRPLGRDLKGQRSLPRSPPRNSASSRRPPPPLALPPPPFPRLVGARHLPSPEPRRRRRRKTGTGPRRHRSHPEFLHRSRPRQEGAAGGSRPGWGSQTGRWLRGSGGPQRNGSPGR